MRPIDGDALKEKIDNIWNGRPLSFLGARILAMIDNAPTISADRPQGEWIPCSERLPEEETDVLVTVYFMGLKQRHPNGWNDHIKPSYYVEVASHINGEWTSFSDEYKVARDRHVVIAWRPLPEPYREDKQ